MIKANSHDEDSKLSHCFSAGDGSDCFGVGK